MEEDVGSTAHTLVCSLTGSIAKHRASYRAADLITRRRLDRSLGGSCEINGSSVRASHDRCHDSGKSCGKLHDGRHRGGKSAVKCAEGSTGWNILEAEKSLGVLMYSITDLSMVSKERQMTALLNLTSAMSRAEGVTQDYSIHSFHQVRRTVATPLH